MKLYPSLSHKRSKIPDHIKVVSYKEFQDMYYRTETLNRSKQFTPRDSPEFRYPEYTPDIKEETPPDILTVTPPWESSFMLESFFPNGRNDGKPSMSKSQAQFQSDSAQAMYLSYMLSEANKKVFLLENKNKELLWKVERKKFEHEELPNFITRERKLASRNNEIESKLEEAESENKKLRSELSRLPSIPDLTTENQELKRQITHLKEASCASPELKSRIERLSAINRTMSLYVSQYLVGSSFPGEKLIALPPQDISEYNDIMKENSLINIQQLYQYNTLINITEQEELDYLRHTHLSLITGYIKMELAMKAFKKVN